MKAALSFKPFAPFSKPRGVQVTVSTLLEDLAFPKMFFFLSWPVWSMVVLARIEPPSMGITLVRCSLEVSSALWSRYTRPYPQDISTRSLSWMTRWVAFLLRRLLLVTSNVSSTSKCTTGKSVLMKHLWSAVAPSPANFHVPGSFSSQMALTACMFEIGWLSWNTHSLATRPTMRRLWGSAGTGIPFMFSSTTCQLTICLLPESRGVVSVGASMLRPSSTL
mmetsp:Transcript_13451/g.26100  ORF Transcript_13451/g.26100 Transcript_13451/m.26100 type:complete len:221 (+) Transcript_13451:872-1534(+)